MGRLDGKVALITGASKGLGEADARLFAAEGATVVLTDVDADNGEQVAKEIGGTASFVEQDVRDEAQWARIVDDVVAKHSKLDILVNNAGVVEPGNIENQTTDEWRFVNAVSSDGTFFGCRNAVRVMKESGGGSIINMASVASLQGEPYVFAYCAAKGAVEAMTRAVAVHCAQMKYNIRCNSIHPSGIQTPMVASVGGKMIEKKMVSLDEAGSSAGLSKIGEPNDIAYMALYLASDESKFVNGARMVVDNSMTVTMGVVPE